MPIYLRQSTASQEVPLGYFLDSADGNSEKTGLTINNTDIKVWKNGATSAVNKNSGGAIEIANGLYYAVLDAIDSNTIGPLVLFIHVSGALSVRVECCVLDEAVFDSMFGTVALATIGNIGTLQTGDSYAKITDATYGLAALKTLIDAVDDYVDTEVLAILNAVDPNVSSIKTTIEGFSDKLTAHVAAVGKLVVGVGSDTTHVVFSTVDGAAPSAVDDFYNGRVIIFTSGILTKQAVQITDYVGSTKTATITAATGSAAQNVTAVIV